MQQRRQFLSAVSAAFAGFVTASCTHGPRALALTSGRVNSGSPVVSSSVVGPLREDPLGILDLPDGFTYRVISRVGDAMFDGFKVPDRADGMGLIDLGGGEIALVRNHELKPHHDSGGVVGLAYDTVARSLAPLPGGTTTLILDASTLEVKRQHRSLAGTIRNCSGGVTPWGSWLSCEETTEKAGGRLNKDHGYVFEVPATARGLVDPVPLKAMGRFNHEAACVDPETGIVYLTEDRGDSLFYRFVPNQLGDLTKGGTLQALALQGVSDTRNWKAARSIRVGQDIKADWITLDDVEAPKDDLRNRGARLGASLFARGEGLFMGDGELYFTATSGGSAGQGQIFRLKLRTGGEDTLDLFFESEDAKDYSFGDNICVAPYGHLVVCEDQYSNIVSNHLRGITPDGASYSLARLTMQTELAGACFAPDGQTMFVNAYSPAMTFAIRGPWPIST